MEPSFRLWDKAKEALTVSRTRSSEAEEAIAALTKARKGPSADSNRLAVDAGSANVWALISYAGGLVTINEYGEAVLDAAVKQRKRLERRDKLATNLSYTLFAAGWALGLLGKLLKVRALSGEGV